MIHTRYGKKTYLNSNLNKFEFEVGEHCLFVLCGTCGTKAKGRSLIELSDLHMQSRSNFLWSLYDWMHVLSGIPSMSFVDFIDYISL